MQIAKWLGKYLRDRLGITETRHQIKMLRDSVTKELAYTHYLSNLSNKGLFSPTVHQIPDNISKLVHSNDIMFHFQIRKCYPDFDRGMEDYFRIGKLGAQQLYEVVNKFQLKHERILDFGSGYGRMSRFLPHFFPASEITVSEVKENALQFQQSQFGFQSILHSNRAGDFPTTKFDLISALSVFTHLNENNFREWLQKLLCSLTDEGALIFTYNELESEERERDFLFIRQSEDSALSFIPDALKDTETYGSTRVSRQFIRQLINGDKYELIFPEGGLAGNQQTAIVQNRKIG